MQQGEVSKPLCCALDEIGTEEEEKSRILVNQPMEPAMAMINKYKLEKDEIVQGMNHDDSNFESNRFA